MKHHGRDRSRPGRQSRRAVLCPAAWPLPVGHRNRATSGSSIPSRFRDSSSCALIATKAGQTSGPAFSVARAAGLSPDSAGHITRPPMPRHRRQTTPTHRRRPDPDRLPQRSRTVRPNQRCTYRQRRLRESPIRMPPILPQRLCLWIASILRFTRASHP